MFLLLAAAGLLRPEAWILSGVYFLWMSWGADWDERFRYAALTAIGPLGWVATDFIVTGDPLFSLTSTQDLAAELRSHEVGRRRAVRACRSCLRGTVKTPVFFAGLLGLAIAIWKFPLRTIVPLMLFLAGAFTFVATGLVGPVGDRALPAGPVGDDDPVRRGRAGRLDDGARAARACGARGRSGAAVITVAGLAYTAYRPPSLERFNNELSFRGEQGQSLHRLLETVGGRARRCAAARCRSRRTS